MRIKLLTAIFITCLSYSHAQQLSVSETIYYMKDLVTKYSTPTDRSNKIKSLDLTISEYGKIELTRTESHSVWSTVEGDKIRDIVVIVSFKVKDLKTVYASTYSSSTPTINFYSEVEAFEEKYDWNNPYNKKYRLNRRLEIDFALPIEANEKFGNAFKYLISLVKNDPNYNKLDSDPFSNDQFNKDTGINSNATQREEEIAFKSSGALSIIKVNLCGHPKDMIMDTGASEMMISLSTEKELVDKGLIKKENYIESGLYKIADGSIVTARRLRIPYVKIGAFSVKDVECAVSPTGDVHLLGKSFLNRFSQWSIDNVNKKLVLKK